MRARLFRWLLCGEQGDNMRINARLPHTKRDDEKKQLSTELHAQKKKVVCLTMLEHYRRTKLVAGSARISLIQNGSTWLAPRRELPEKWVVWWACRAAVMMAGAWELSWACQMVGPSAGTRAGRTVARKAFGPAAMKAFSSGARLADTMVGATACRLVCCWVAPKDDSTAG